MAGASPILVLGILVFCVPIVLNIFHIAIPFKGVVNVLRGY